METPPNQSAFVCENNLVANDCPVQVDRVKPIE